MLREAGFVAAEPRGRYTYYRLRPEALSVRTVGVANLTAQAHHARRYAGPAPEPDALVAHAKMRAPGYGRDRNPEPSFWRAPRAHRVQVQGRRTAWRGVPVR